MKNNEINKIKYTKLAYIQLIKLLIHKDSLNSEFNNKIITQNLTYKEMIEIINEYYEINKIKKPNISQQSISNLKNRKLRLNPLIRNEYTENFALFIKNKYKDFNEELFYTISKDKNKNMKLKITQAYKVIKILKNKIEYKEIKISQNYNMIKFLKKKLEYKKINISQLYNEIEIFKNKINNIYFYLLLFPSLGVGVIPLIFLYNLYKLILGDNSVSVDNNFIEINPTIIEENLDDSIDISTSPQSDENKKISLNNLLLSTSSKYIIAGVVYTIVILFIGGAIALYWKGGINTEIIIEGPRNPWEATPNTVEGRHGLFISYARVANTNLEDID